MIVAGEFSPGLGGMANVALQRRSAWRRLLHESVELPFMWICVTTLASQAVPVVLRSWFRFEARGLLVTVAAWNRHVASAQTKWSVVVPAQAECGWQEPLDVVAIFATVEMWRGGKLTGMWVGVTIGAILKLHRVDRGLAFRYMAPCALQRGMLALQRVGGGGCMLFHSEGRGLKAVNGVTVRTFASTHALGELSSMWVWLVAVCALLKRQSFHEVSLRVTPYALHLGMFPKQRKLRLGVIKRAIHLGRCNPVPARRAMTGLTSLREAATMRIGMAVVAVAKWDSGVARLVVGPRSVTLQAGNLDVQTGKGITRERMVEVSNIDFFPLGEVVTLQAVGAQPAPMLVLMAIGAVGGNSQKCFTQILGFDG